MLFTNPRAKRLLNQQAKYKRKGQAGKGHVIYLQHHAIIPIIWYQLLHRLCVLIFLKRETVLKSHLFEVDWRQK